MTPTEQVFDWIEHTQLSEWIAGPSMLAFPTILTVHVLGTEFLAGTSAAIALRNPRCARQIPLGRLELFYPILWVALAANVVSGTLLLIGYPYKAFTNPLFYVKLSLIALALYLVVKIPERSAAQSARRQAARGSGDVDARKGPRSPLACLLDGRDRGRALPRLHLHLAAGRHTRRLLKGIAMFTEPEFAQPWELWVRATALHHFIAHNGAWLWPIFQTLHYFGLSLLLGTVGLFDLRVLGVGKAVPPATLHKLIPIGIAGFVLNLLTGIWFFFGFPEQYFYNPSFQLLLAFVAIAGLNVAVFYLTDAFREVKLMPGGADAPLRAKLIAGTSLSAWVAVLACGRLITFYRPPFFH